MRIVAFEIADDARDPSSDDDASPDLPWSALPIKGHEILRGNRAGQWQDGLVEICGMSERRIRRALEGLAAAGYEMRIAITEDKNGRPVFAAKGHALRFQVPPINPREAPQSRMPASSSEPKADASVHQSGPKADASVHPSPQRPIPSEDLSPQSSASDLTGTTGKSGTLSGQQQFQLARRQLAARQGSSI